MHLVVGLGNPGRKYEMSRHNAGFMVVDRLAYRWAAPCDQRQLGALVSKARVGDKPVVLSKPQSYMNLSGQPTASLRGFYKVPVKNVVVVHDDLDIAFGEVRVKNGGGHGGHNGLRDLQARLGDNGFVRVRFGVSRPPPEWDPADYVLGPFTPEQQGQLDDLVDRAADAVEAVIRDGVGPAMNHFNTRTNRGGDDRESGPDSPNA